MSDMSNPVDRLPRDQVGALLQRVMLSRAAALARDGNLQAAGYLLVSSQDPTQRDPASLDLLARIRVQQGSWLEAEQLWQELARLEPTNQNAQAALVRLRSMRQRSAWLTPAVAGTAATALIAALGLAHVAVSRRDEAMIVRLQSELEVGHRALQGRLDEQNSELSLRLKEFAETQMALTQDLKSTDERLAAGLQALAHTQSPEQPLALAFKVKGTRTHNNGRELLIGFDADLFAADGRLKADARVRLRTLARAIVQSQERITLDVTCIDASSAPSAAVSRPIDPSSLALAQRVAALMRQTGVFPQGVISASVTDEVGATSAAWRHATAARQKAIVLRVSRAPLRSDRPTN